VLFHNNYFNCLFFCVGCISSVVSMPTRVLFCAQLSLAYRRRCAGLFCCAGSFFLLFCLLCGSSLLFVFRVLIRRSFPLLCGSLFVVVLFSSGPYSCVFLCSFSLCSFLPLLCCLFFRITLSGVTRFILYFLKILCRRRL